jgi:alkanesulfonate monooxygenase SsuD/methylene tetrahydromethanopterin reductase-like flavin-dependent oxidoreductase (luciferase family)
LKLGLILPLFSGDPEKVLVAAREAEALDFDGVFVFDHLFPPGAPADRASLEAFATLGAVIAATDRIAVGTLVARAGLRPVGLLAKMAAWLDAASRGRLILGLGTGDPIDRLEHRTYGIPMMGKGERRAHLEEAVGALRALFEGRPYPGGSSVPPIAGPLLPRPPRSGGPPIWIGGQADEVVAIAARTADGWNGWGMQPDEYGAKVRLARQHAARAGRTIEATWAGILLVGADRAETRLLTERRRARGLDDEAWIGTAGQAVGFLEGLRSAGATWAITVLAGPADRRHLVADTVLPALREGRERSPVGS